MTLDEFLAWEHDQEYRWEFDGGRPVFRDTGTMAAATVLTNLCVALHGRLRDRRGPCEYHTSILKVRTGLGTIRYPDASVSCTRLAPRDTVVERPVVVFEVPDEDTAALDRAAKAREYMATPSLRRYVMPEPFAVAATVFARAPDGRWTVEILLGRDAALSMHEIGVGGLPLAELYDGLDLDEQRTPRRV